MKVSASAVERRSRIHAVLNHVSIRLKLGSLAVFGALILSSIAGYMGWHEYESDYDGRREGIRQSVETARSVIEWAHRQEAAGAMTRAQAQAVAIRIVNDARYRSSEYLWINDLDARVLAHPFKPELVGSDEIGDLIGEMKVMSEQLNAMMSEVHQAAQELATTSRQIASSNQDLSSRTERTAANLQQAASTLAEINGSVRENAEASRRAADTVRKADEVAAQGGATVAEAVEQMQGVTGTSTKIADIIGLIDSIAFQTNILALNAAVEAARAGTQGAGFAVVAAEVRGLAQRSAGAASEIKKLINESVQCTRDGARKVDAAGSSMGRIVDSIGEVNSLIGAISRASARQSDEVEQVNDAIAQLEQMTQQNAALVEESAAAAEGLHVQAHHLTRLVDRFKLRHDETLVA